MIDESKEFKRGISDDDVIRCRDLLCSVGVILDIVQLCLRDLELILARGLFGLDLTLLLAQTVVVPLQEVQLKFHVFILARDKS